MAGTAGRSGRRPKPTARKALAGNPGKRALNKDEPVFTPIKGVEPPEWFAEEDLPLATIMWQLTTKELCGQGLLCVTDLAVLERWCVAYEFWRRAVKNIARQSCEDKSLSLEQFEGQPCILAFDLARKLDMNSMARLYTREIDGKTHYYSVAPCFWVPYDTVYSVEKNEDRRTAERFQKWVEMGVLTVTDGAEVDYRYILEEAKAANKISPVSESPIDPFGATGLSHDLADEDLNPITIIQNYTNMSDPMKELEAAIESGRFHHDGNPIMTWCIGNVVGKTIPGNDDVVKPVKEQAENKIDGAVALIMAVGRAMLYEKEDTLSDHIESYGIRSL